MKKTFMLLALAVSGTMAEVKIESVETNINIKSTENVMMQEVRTSRMSRASREVRVSRATRKTRLARTSRTTRTIHYVSVENPTHLASLK